MYGADDVRCAEAALRRAAWMLALPLALLLIGYAAAAIAGSQLLMLVLLLAGFVYGLLIGDLLLLPALRYRRFLREMQQGLRRSVRCTLQDLNADAEMQDGVRVHALQVVLPEDGDSRIFYINVSKAALLPPMGTAVQLESYGRHVVNCGKVNG